MPEFDDGDEQRDRLLRIVTPLKSFFSVIDAPLAFYHKLR
jgi:hypothetical protein